MALFVIERQSPLSAEEAWRRLTDWRRHADHVPLTRIAGVTPAPNGVGGGFVARTGIGPLRFDDPMEVVRWQPPAPDRAGCCRLVKRGSVVTGWAELEVHPQGPGSRLVWREELRVRGLPRLLDTATGWSGRLLFGRVLAGLLGE